MTHSEDKKSHAFKGIREKLNPTIYQVRFMKLDEPIRFESFSELKELGDWLSTSTHMWSCYSTMYKYNREEFERSS